jgi:membrane protein
MNISNFFDFILNTFERVFRREDSVRSRFINFIIRLFKEFKRDKCLIRASSLSYTSLMALIPLTALSFSLFTAFDAFSGIKESAQKSIINILVPTRQNEFMVYIDQFLDNSKTMGIIGLLLFAVTSIMLLNRISESFNAIWGSKNRRSFIGKFTSYSSVIVFGTLFIGTSFTITAPIRKFLDGFPEIQFIIRWLIVLSPSLFIFFTFLLMITAIPAGKVKLKSSLLGAFVGTVLWGLARGAFTEGASYVIRMSKIYGSIAVIPIFLFWLYLIWIIIFLALEISYVYQHKREWKSGAPEIIPSPIYSIELGLEVFLHIAKPFDDGSTYPSAHNIANTLSMTEDSVNQILKRLKEADLVYETDESVRKLFPSRSLNKIMLKDVLGAILGTNPTIKITSASETTKIFLSAGYDIIGARTVEDLLRH